eukprot:766373-Hanusia_phi.AAC.4
MKGVVGGSPWSEYGWPRLSGAKLELCGGRGGWNSVMRDWAPKYGQGEGRSKMERGRWRRRE